MTELTAEQRHAVRIATREPIAIVTGGPGTGKTTTMRSVAERLREQGKSYRLMAPTGKAASRLSEQVGDVASTIHRAIGWQMSGEPLRSERDPLTEDAIIVDESSMIDAGLLSRLMRAVAPTSSLLLVGDDNQLPPVAPGAPFRDLLAAGIVPSVRLTAIFRQGEGSPIAEAATAILNGQQPIDAAANGGAFYWIETDRDENIPSIVRRCVETKIPERFGIKGDDKIQVLCPGKEGLVSVDTLNGSLASIYNPVSALSRDLRVGDRVINTKNNYELGVFNGEIGRVESMMRNRVAVKFPDKVCIFTGMQRDPLIRAWCLTVHRSQGSEYPAIVVALGSQHTRLLTRRLVYTAVTRAATLCVVISTPETKQRVLSNRHEERRVTALQERLRVLWSAQPADDGASEGL